MAFASMRSKYQPTSLFSSRSSSLSRSRIKRNTILTQSIPLKRLLFPITIVFFVSIIFLTSLPQQSSKYDSSSKFASHISTPMYNIPTSPRAPFGYFSNGSIYTLTQAQKSVRDATRATFRAYMNNCMGEDEFIPTTKACNPWFNIGLTALDSIDTLVLMDLREEYAAVRSWAETSLSFENVDEPVSLFELNIRAIAGLISAYELTSDSLWLEKATKLADYVLIYFSKSKSGCPPPNIFIGRRAQTKIFTKPLDTYSSPAEVGTLQLEFRTLSRLTGIKKYALAVDRCMERLIQAIPQSNLVPTGFDVSNGQFFGERITIGANVDSFYEMMLKTWIAFGKKDVDLRRSFEKIVRAVFNTLIRNEHGYTYVSERLRIHAGSLKHNMEHLSCFFPGVLAVASLHGMGEGLENSTVTDAYLPMARRLTRSCYAMSRGMSHGLAGEVTDFSKPMPQPAVILDNCLLRPEIIEALHYMDRIDPQAGFTYKKWGLDMWNSMLETAQVQGEEIGVLSNVHGLLRPDISSLEKQGKLHSFVIAETFKYLFLLFDDRKDEDGPLSLKKWVYNTEAHPVRIIDV